MGVSQPASSIPLPPWLDIDTPDPASLDTIILASAAADATTKANGAQTAAGTDATTKANAAQAAAIAAAATDATTKADAAQAAAIAAGAAALGPKLRSGRTYFSVVGSTTVANTADGTMYATPFYFQNPVTIDRLQIEVTTGVAGAVARVGLYADDNGAPGALIFGSASLDCSTNGLKTVTLSQAIAAGVAWFAILKGGAGAAMALRATGIPDNQSVARQVGLDALPSTNNEAPIFALQRSGLNGEAAMPNPFGGTPIQRATGLFRVAFRIA